MRVTFTRSDLAAYAQMPAEPMLACSRALARFSELHEPLAQNTNLPAPVWRQLWGKRPELRRAVALASRPLARPERDLVLGSETRSKVLVALVEHNVLTADEQQALVRTAPDAVLSALLAQSWVDPSLRGPVAERVGGLDLLAELAYDATGAFDDARAAELLETFDAWGPDRRLRDRSQLLKVLLHMRPALVPAATRSGSDAVVTAACGSLDLTAADARAAAGIDPQGPLTDADLVERRFALLALVNNPVVGLDVVEEVRARCAAVTGLEQVVSSAERRRTRPAVDRPYGQVEDAEQLRWLVNRSLPSEYHPGRVIELAQLVGNPHLDDWSRGRVEEAVRDLVIWDPPLARALSPLLASIASLQEPLAAALARPTDQPTRAPHPSYWQVVEAFCTAAQDRLGGNAEQWETTVGLLEEFDGTVEELLDLSVHL